MKNRMFVFSVCGRDWYVGFFPYACFGKWIQIYK